MNRFTLRGVLYGTLIVVGGIAIALGMFVGAYAGILIITANHGKGAVVHWDNAVPPAIGGNNAPRIHQEGTITERGCSFSLRLTSNPWGYQTRARTVWKDTDKCERVVEVFN